MSDTPQAPSIFISYRHDDTAAGHAGRLHADFVRHYGSDRVFMDVKIPPGADFAKTLKTTVGSCSVLLAVIGRNWLTMTDAATGKRRLDNPKDWVRIEIATALARNIWVIPILVHESKMPGADALPNNLKSLARRNAYEIRAHHWDDDIAGLIKSIDDELNDKPAPAATDISVNSESAIEAARHKVRILQLPGGEGLLDRPMMWRRLGRKWKVGDIVRLGARPAEPGAQPVMLSQIGVICAGDREVVQVSWFYGMEQGRARWHKPEAVPPGQLRWLWVAV